MEPWTLGAFRLRDYMLVVDTYLDAFRRYFVGYGLGA